MAEQQKSSHGGAGEGGEKRQITLQTGSYYEGAVSIGGDHVSGGTINKAEYHGPVTAPTYIGQGGQGNSTPEAERMERLAQQLEDVRQALDGNARSPHHTQALQQLASFTYTLAQTPPSPFLLQATLIWFQDYFPEFIPRLAAVVFADEVLEVVEAAQETLQAEFYERLAPWVP